MSASPLIEKLRDLARINRLGGRGALADTLDETVEALREADQLVRDFPTLIFHKPGTRCVVGATETSEYAFRLGDWTRRRESFLARGSKR